MKWLSYADKTALVSGDRRISYGQLIGMVRRTGEKMSEFSKRGDRIAIIGAHSPEWVLALYSIWNIHATVVPIDFMSTPEEVAYILDDCTPTVVWCDAKTQEKTDQALALMKTAHPAVMRLESLADCDATESKDAEGVGESSDDELAMIIYTSGTTGSPKGVMLTFENLRSNTEACSTQIEVFIPDDRVMVILPLHHAYPLMATVVMPMSINATAVFALDMTADLSAGPWASPYRNQPVNFKSSDGTDMFRERPIGCQQSGMTMVCQMRDWLPDAVGGVTYFNMDDASMVAYVPVYCGIDRIPDPFRRENNDIREFSTESAFWMNNFVANMVYPRYSAMIGDLREAQTELEDFYAEDQKTVEAEAPKLTAAERTEYLTRKTLDYTDMMMKRWDKLAKLLIVKHNDQIMQPSENGVVVAGRRTSPAYAPAFIDAVKSETGDRYVKPAE